MPPGHKFELFFPVWQKNNWEMASTNKTEALKKTLSLEGSRVLLERLLERQAHQASACGKAVFSIKAKSTSPFLTGIGLEHPLENGFSFLKPYGLPYLPGSGVKGVLKKACEELALCGGSPSSPDIAEVWALFGFEGGSAYLSGAANGSATYIRQKASTLRKAFNDWIDRLNPDKTKTLLEPLIDQGAASAAERDNYKNDVRIFLRDILQSKQLRERIHNRGALVFWDVFPKPPADTLSIDILTPHYSHYYQKGKTPHDSGQPTPNPFLTVPQGSLFCFNVQYIPSLGCGPSLEGRWKDLLTTAFAYAFDWLGFGAKTAVGYGQMAPHQAQQGSPTTPKETSKSIEPKTTTISGVIETWEKPYLNWNPGSQTLTATFQNRKAEGKGSGLIPEEVKAKLKKGKQVDSKVVVERVGNSYKIVSVEF
jgi:CRISPR-associated protein Cmr6